MFQCYNIYSNVFFSVFCIKQDVCYPCLSLLTVVSPDVPTDPSKHHAETVLCTPSSLVI